MIVFRKKHPIDQISSNRDKQLGLIDYFFLSCRYFKIQGFFVHKNPEEEAQRSCAQSAKNYKTEREPVLRRLSKTSQVFCIRVIVYGKPKILKKTFSVLSVILINLWLKGYKISVNKNICQAYIKPFFVNPKLSFSDLISFT